MPLQPLTPELTIVFMFKDDSRRFPLFWLLIVLGGIAIFLLVFHSGKQDTREESPTSPETPAEISSQSKPASARGGWLKHAKRKRTTEEQDEITRMKKEVFAREMEVGKDIINQDYQTALEKLVEYYTWTFENDFAASAGVRSSFALSHWKSLIEAYPPAADKLREMADQLEDTMRTEEFADVKIDKNYRADLPPEQRDDFIARALMREISNFNSVLGTPERGIGLLTDLLRNEPDVAQASWRGAEDILYETRSYELLREFIPDINAEYENVRRQVQNVQRQVQNVQSSRLPKSPGITKEQFEEIQRSSTRRFIESRIGRLFDFGVGTDQTNLVQELARRAMDDFPGASDIFERFQ